MWSSNIVKPVVYIHNGIVLSNKKNKCMAFVATWMELKGIMLSEISQKEKEKYRMVSLLGGTKGNHTRSQKSKKTKLAGKL